MEVQAARLIEEIRERPCLYDVTSQFYRDLTMRQEAWEEIAYLFNESVDSVKASWTKLRNAFSSAKKRRILKSGQATSIITPWKYEKEMAFLTPFMESRQAHINPEKSEEKSNSEDFSDKPSDDDTQETPNFKELERSSSSLEHEGIPAKRLCTSKSKSYRNLDPADEMMQIMKKNVELRQMQHQEKRYTEYDAVDMFYLSMARTVKTLSRVTQAEIRMQLCQIVSEAEISEMRGKPQNS
ncbi:uncharacterized protein LOC123679723 [Harmonia axyridis]|uniref:uncharacterized protein LOC123679723 n=1 Tax=Harmonia axyridis TaxID=115357 RepID=UPI001E276A5B|nr:uncharacterized protein LOC123679723 [Harmonia axyridis]